MGLEHLFPSWFSHMAIGRRPQFLTEDYPIGLLECPYNMAADFPLNKNSKRENKEDAACLLSSGFPSHTVTSTTFYFLKKIYLFIYLWLYCVFIVVCGLSLVAASGGLLSSLWCGGFSLWWLFLLQSMGSRCAVFSGCGT